MILSNEPNTPYGDGVVRYTHFGEGAYVETEDVICDLLAETGFPPLG